ncbi:MAG: hypothetical protein AUH31_07230 [Armatimonadetes bacterium 13_1_40CM_64_14]|nr:MAG: hypothetical protein AUH31_07230 [Armatimonadetes bacterium 13_1_40CM_64_14]
MPLAFGLAAAEFPIPTGFVNDFAGVLNQGARLQLEERLQAYARETTTEIAIATLPSLGGRTIEDASVRLFEQWRIGKRDKNNGILIVVALQDRRVRIEVGYGLEGKVPDAQAGRIIRDIITPSFRQGDYAGGLTAAVDELARLIGAPSAASPRPAPRPGRSSPNAWLVGEVLFFLTILGAGVWGSRPRCPRCRSILRRDVVRHVVLSGIPSITVRYACPRCGYNDLRVEHVGSTAYWGGGGWSSGGFGFGGSGGFGGFGGGSSGGGGASGSW